MCGARAQSSKIRQPTNTGECQPEVVVREKGWLATCGPRVTVTMMRSMRSGVSELAHPNRDAMNINESTYPEVRSARFRDPSTEGGRWQCRHLPSVLGSSDLFGEVLFPGVNQFFYFRYPLDRFVIKNSPRRFNLSFGIQVAEFEVRAGKLFAMLSSLSICKAWARYRIFPSSVSCRIILGRSPSWLVGAGPACTISIAPTLYRFTASIPICLWPRD